MDYEKLSGKLITIHFAPGYIRNYRKIERGEVPMFEVLSADEAGVQVKNEGKGTTFYPWTAINFISIPD